MSWGSESWRRRKQKAPSEKRERFGEGERMSKERSRSGEKCGCIVRQKAPSGRNVFRKGMEGKSTHEKNRPPEEGTVVEGGALRKEEAPS